MDCSITFDSPTSGPGVYQGIHTEVDLTTHGNGPIGKSHNNIPGREDPADTPSIVTTPDPTTGLLVGACFLSTFVALRRRDVKNPGARRFGASGFALCASLLETRWAGAHSPLRVRFGPRRSISAICFGHPDNRDRIKPLTPSY